MFRVDGPQRGATGKRFIRLGELALEICKPPTLQYSVLDRKVKEYNNKIVSIVLYCVKSLVYFV